MKILQIIQKQQLRGAEIFACQLSEELIKLGNEVEVLVLAGKPNPDFPYKLKYHFTYANLKHRFTDFKTYKKIAEIIKKGNYDVIQANASDTLKYAVFSKKLFGWNNKLIFRNANKMSDFVNSKLKYILNYYLLNHTNLIISVSNNCEIDIHNTFKKRVNKTTTITIGTYKFVEIKNITKSKNKIILNIGSFVPEKNHKFLIDIFYRYQQKYPKTELWLVGDGKLMDAIQNKVKQLGIESKVKFWGFRKDIISIIKSADILLMPSKIEGLPGVILEAFSCGIPVVASSVGGIPEVVINNYNGFNLTNFDINEYVARIEQILNDDKLKTEFGKNGKKLIYEQYLMPQIGKKFNNAYLNLLDEKN